VQTDWYKTGKRGTYLIVPAGADPHALQLPSEVSVLLEALGFESYLVGVDSVDVAAQFGFVGVDSCVGARGYCVLRS
jgi:hypothetical protein